MDVRVPRTQIPIKAGWAARASALNLTAHGRDREIADLNLQRAVACFLAPFQRAGTVRQELDGSGLEYDGEAWPIAIVLVDA
jgi:hypothetical protein